jgi:hypothetical protein
MQWLTDGEYVSLTPDFVAVNAICWETGWHYNKNIPGARFPASL